MKGLFRASQHLLVAKALDHKVNGNEYREKISNERRGLDHTPEELKYRCYKEDPAYAHLYRKSEGTSMEVMVVAIVGLLTTLAFLAMVWGTQ
jgi:hypothetical protein